MGVGHPRKGEERCECCGIRKRDYPPGMQETEARFCRQCREFLRAEGRLKAKDAKEEAQNLRVPVVAPDGSKVILCSEEEKQFYESRVKQFLTNFDFNESSDKGLLSLLMTLEIQCKRIEGDLLTCKRLERPDLAKVLIKLTEQVSEVQTLLGLARGKRKENEALNVHEYFDNLMQRFALWKESEKPAWHAGVKFNEQEKVWDNANGPGKA